MLFFENRQEQTGQVSRFPIQVTACKVTLSTPVQHRLMYTFFIYLFLNNWRKLGTRLIFRDLLKMFCNTFAASILGNQ